MSGGRPSTTSEPCWSWVISNNMAVADVLRSLQPWSMNMAASGKVTCACSASVSVSVPRLQLLQTWSWLTPGNYSTTLSVWPVIEIAEDWLQASALDCPTTIPFPIVFIIQYATNTNDHQRTRRRITKTDSEHTPSLSIYCTPQYSKQEHV